MTEATLLSELVTRSARLSPHACALTSDIGSLSYEELGHAVLQFASGLAALGLARGDRVAIYLDKRFETVIGSFGASAAGAVFVPVNPILKPEQVAQAALFLASDDSEYITGQGIVVDGGLTCKFS